MLLLWCSCVEFIYYAVILMFLCRVYIMMLFLCFFCGVYLLWWCFFAEFIYHVVPLTFLCRVYIWCWCSFAEFIYYSVAFVGHGSCAPLWNLWWLIVLLVFLCAIIMWCDSCVPKYYDTTKIKVFSVIYLQRNMTIDLWRYFELHNRIRQHSNDLSSQDEITDLMFSIISAWFKSNCSFTWRQEISLNRKTIIA